MGSRAMSTAIGNFYKIIHCFGASIAGGQLNFYALNLFEIREDKRAEEKKSKTCKFLRGIRRNDFGYKITKMGLVSAPVRCYTFGPVARIFCGGEARREFCEGGVRIFLRNLSKCNRRYMSTVVAG